MTYHTTETSTMTDSRQHTFVRRGSVALPFAAAALILAAAAARAQVPIPAPEQAGPIALRGATIHTVTNGVIENGTILFEDGVITAVGTDVALPAGVTTVDVSGKHIYPGLIDANTQMGISEIGSVDVTNDTDELGDFNPNLRAEVAVNAESRHIGTSRTNGVLVSVTSPSGGLISGLSAALNMDGWTWEQMTLQSAVALNMNWPNPRDEEEYEEELRRIRDFFAEARAYRDAKRASDVARSDSKYDAMIPVLDGDIPVIVSANDIRQIQDAITWADTEGVRIAIRGGADADRVADRLVEKNVPVMLTSVMSAPQRPWEPYDGAYSLPARLYEKGVSFSIVGGGSAPYTNRLPYEAGSAVAFGLPEEEAIKAVTLNPAQALGIADRVGSLEPGKDATLLITTGSPLDYLANVEQAYIEGREIDMRDIHRFFFEKYMEKLRQLQPWISQE